jgi:hypothetical protein
VRLLPELHRARKKTERPDIHRRRPMPDHVLGAIADRGLDVAEGVRTE